MGDLSPSTQAVLGPVIILAVVVVIIFVVLKVTHSFNESGESNV